GTLFDSEAFKASLECFAGNVGVDRDQFLATYQQSKNQYGSYDLFSHLDKYFDIDEATIRAKAEEFFKGHDYQYPDVADFLVSIGDDDQTIFTLGSDRFQRFKINLTSSLSCLDLLQTEAAKSRQLIELTSAGQGKGLRFRGKDYQNIYYLDNRVEFFITDPLAGLVQIRIRRTGDYYSQDPTPEGILEVGSLSEISLMLGLS
ncbi:hypothetical protein KC853_00505, partial [Candidatus Saccharibacteria bacterium]|nr:hypothetical protein [Candidatus Saccharibacteria bacterium]